MSMTKVDSAHAQLLRELENLKIDAKTQADSEQPPLVLGALESEVAFVDGRSAALKRYLRKHDSPLFEHTDLLVREADAKGYDYRLLVAIACQESTCCKVLPEGSHNCWGWGIYGDKVTRFASYEEAIMTISNGIKENYIDKGLITTEDIMNKYTPSSNGSWAWAVRYFFNKIDNS